MPRGSKKLQKGGNESTLQTQKESSSMLGGFWNWLTQQQPAPGAPMDAQMQNAPLPAQAPAPTSAPVTTSTSTPEASKSIMSGLTSFFKKDNQVDTNASTPEKPTTGGSKKKSRSKQTKSKSKQTKSKLHK